LQVQGGACRGCGVDLRRATRDATPLAELHALLRSLTAKRLARLTNVRTLNPGPTELGF